MKKILAIALTFMLVLSVGAAACADTYFSPGKIPTVDDLPPESESVSDADIQVDDLDGESEAVENADVTDSEVKIIPIKEMTEEEKKAMNEALKIVVKDGALPVDSFIVKSDHQAIILISLAEDAVIYLVYPDNTIVKLLARDLASRPDGRREIPVDGSCRVVIAKKAEAGPKLN